MALWMVRAGRHGEQEHLALEKNMVVIGWEGMTDLSGVNTREEMKEAYVQAYPDSKPPQIANQAGQPWVFKEKIQIGDLVAVPLKTRSAVAIGKITGPYKYIPDNPEGAKHTRAVEWVRKDIPRTGFGQDLLYSLGALMTVCQIKCNNAEDRVKTILKGKPDPFLHKPSAPIDTGEDEGEDGGTPPLNLEEYAQDQIRSCLDANFKGHELTRLITALLKAQGYQTYMAPPGPDGGMDILAGRGPMGFDAPRLCVQVKSGSSPVDVTALRELQGVMKNFGAEQGLFISWSGFKDSVYKEARSLYFEIRLWDANNLVQALLDNYEKLEEDIQAELPLKRIWAMVLEE